MPPLNLGPRPADVPADHPGLLRLLASRPGPALIWHGIDTRGAEAKRADGPAAEASPAPAPSRVELSGRVLENWAVKMIGLFTEELDLRPGDLVIVDSAPHWKAAAAALAASALGCRVRISGAGEPAEDPALVLTADPARWEDSEALGDAELAALSPGLLDSSFEEAVGQELPAWVLDVSAEVRQQPDQLLAPLPEVPLPAAELQRARQQEPHGPTPPGCLLTETSEEVETSGTWSVRRWAAAGTVEAMLEVWAHSGRVVLWQGPHRADDGAALPRFTQMRGEEGL